MTTEELALKAYPNEDIVGSTERIDIAPALREGYAKGFNECKELLKNQYVLSIDDIKTIVYTSYAGGYTRGSAEGYSYPEILDNIINAFQSKRDLNIDIDEQGKLKFK